MNKAPAFQLYANDFLAGTQHMSDAEVGLYLRLLLAQWNDGSLPNDDEELLRYGRPGKQRLDHIKAKFKLGRNGRLRNSRLERERQKQAKFRRERCKAGRMGAQKRWERPVPAVAEPVAKDEPTANAVPKDEAPPRPPAVETAPPPRPESAPQAPTFEAVKANAAAMGMTEEEAGRFWHHFEAAGWIDKNRNPVRNWQSRQTLWHADNPAKPPKESHPKAENGPNPSAGVSPSVAAMTASKEYERVCARIKQVAEGVARDATGTKFYTPEERKELQTLRARRDELRKQLKITI